MYIKYDANPSGSPTGDCVIRAIATITRRPWRDVHWDLAILSNQRCKMMDDNVIWHEYLKNLGFNEIIGTVNDAVKAAMHQYFPQINFND